MNTKRITWICAALGGWLGGYVPFLWGAGYFSFSSLFCSALGAIAGIWIAYRITRTY